jgi:hypothetical protein
MNAETIELSMIPQWTEHHLREGADVRFRSNRISLESALMRSCGHCGKFLAGSHSIPRPLKWVFARPKDMKS